MPQNNSFDMHLDEFAVLQINISFDMYFHESAVSFYETNINAFMVAKINVRIRIPVFYFISMKSFKANTLSVTAIRLRSQECQERF